MKSGIQLVLLLASLPLAPISVMSAEASNEQLQRSYGDDMLRPEEIRACLKLRAALIQRESSLSKEEKRLKTQSANVKRMGSRLMAEQETLDANDLDAVSRFQAELSLYSRAEDDYNARATRYNTKLELFRQDQQRFNTTCADKRYYDDEYRAALDALDERVARLLIKEGRGSGLAADRAVKAPLVQATATKNASTMADQTGDTFSTVQTGHLYVQLGAFRQQASVDELRQKIGDAYPLHLKRLQNGLMIVRTGPFESRQAAEQARRDIAARFRIEGFVRSEPARRQSRR